MSTRFNPRLGLALLAVLGVCAFLALQPSPDEDLAVQGRERPGGTAAQSAVASPVTREQRSQPAGNAASTPSPAQARELAHWAAAWSRRASEPWPPTVPDARWSWAPQQPPAPPPAPVQEAPPPVAPAFPYAWVGRFVDDTPRAVIAGPNHTWVLVQGEVIEGQWRVGAIAERQLTVTYLPLNQEQSVALK